MSRKRKDAVEQPIEKQKVESVVSYREFFSKCVALKQVKPWQEDEIRAFFKDLGLTDKESEDKYKEALAKY